MSGTIESRVITPSGGTVQGTSVLSAGPVSSGNVLAADGSGGAHWIAVSGTGTVISIGVITDSTTSSIFANTTNNLTGSPVTTSGNITLTLSTQNKNKALMGPATGSDAAPTYRLLVGADLPLPAASTLGGVFSKASVSHNFLTSISSVDGSVGQAQPAFTDISGSVAPTQMPALTGDVTTSAGAVATTVAKIQGVTVSGTTGTGNVVFSASPTFTGTAVFASGTVSGSLKAGNYHLEPVENDSGNSSTAVTIDWSLGSAQKSTLTGNVTYTFSNPVTGGAYLLKIATGAGSFTTTWPAAVKWSGGTAPTTTVTASKVDLINFYYDGTNYYGSFVQNF